MLHILLPLLVADTLLLVILPLGQCLWGGQEVCHKLLIVLIHHTSVGEMGGKEEKGREGRGGKGKKEEGTGGKGGERGKVGKERDGERDWRREGREERRR